MSDTKCKTCRRVGEKLFLKGERCLTPKCAVIRKPYPPGIHSRVSRKGMSEYGLQLREKQKLRNLFQVGERQFRRYAEHAMTAPGADAGEKLMESLRARLDNVMFQSGFVESRSIARQLVSHGHVVVNGKAVKIPSYSVQSGDKIRIQKIKQEDTRNATREKTPAWLLWDEAQTELTVVSRPATASTESSLYNTTLIIEYYAR